MGLLRPKLHTGHHHFCLIPLAKSKSPGWLRVQSQELGQNIKLTVKEHGNDTWPRSRIENALEFDLEG